MMGDPAEPVGAGSATFTVTGNPAINLRSLSVARSLATSRQLFSSEVRNPSLFLAFGPFDRTAS